MKTLKIAFLLLFLQSYGVLQYVPHGIKKSLHRKYNSGEVLVKFSPKYVRENDQELVIKKKGATKIQSLDKNGLIHVKVRDGQSVEDAVKEFSKLQEVEYVQPNFRYHKLTADVYYTNQWALKNTGQQVPSNLGGNYTTYSSVTAGNDINIEEAWNYITDCSAVKIAVIDTGINYNHVDLASNMWAGNSYHGIAYVNGNGTSSADPMDLDMDGHGSNVAGIIGSVGNNGVGTSGVCWKANMMAVRVLDASGSGSTADIVYGIQYASNNGAKVINMSLGQGEDDASLKNAISTHPNILFVVAAGNDGLNNDTSSTPTYPCKYNLPNLVCVGALDQSFNLASFSNYGNQSVTIAAPGTNILSLKNGSVSEITENFSTSWNKATSPTCATCAWTGSSCSFTTGNLSVMINPSNWCSANSTYSNNLNASTYKTFNLSTAKSSVLNFYAFYDLQDGSDYFNVGVSSSGVNPFPSNVVDQLTGTPADGADSADYLSYDISNCTSSQCSVGFQLTSNAATVASGVGIVDFSIQSLSLNNTSYHALSGTSMATPFVTGVAAMIMAYNPQYSVADTVQSLKSGSKNLSSLNGKTVAGITANTGMALNAFGSLSYIAPPTGVNAVVQ